MSVSPARLIVSSAPRRITSGCAVSATKGSLGAEEDGGLEGALTGVVREGSGDLGKLRVLAEDKADTRRQDEDGELHGW